MKEGVQISLSLSLSHPTDGGREGGLETTDECEIVDLKRLELKPGSGAGPRTGGHSAGEGAGQRAPGEKLNSSAPSGHTENLLAAKETAGNSVCASLECGSVSWISTAPLYAQDTGFTRALVLAEILCTFIVK